MAGLLALVASTGRAQADEDDDAPKSDWHLGVNLRTDPGTGQVRFDAGVRSGRADWIVVVDPFGIAGDQHAVDALVSYGFESQPGWRLFLGHRTTAFELGPEHSGYHERAITGLTGDLPRLDGEQWLRGQWGVEVAVNWLRHGNSLPDEWISLSDASRFGSLIDFGFFARFEFASRI